jgi:hypothetical protein
MLSASARAGTVTLRGYGQTVWVTASAPLVRLIVDQDGLLAVAPLVLRLFPPALVHDVALPGDDAPAEAIWKSLWADVVRASQARRSIVIWRRDKVFFRFGSWRRADIDWIAGQLAAHSVPVRRVRSTSVFLAYLRPGKQPP